MYTNAGYSAYAGAFGGAAASASLEETQIVQPSEILKDEQLKKEEDSLKDVPADVRNNRSLLRFLATRKLIHNERQCDKCKRPVLLYARPSSVGRCQWRCSVCKSSWTVVAESNLAGIPGNLLDIVIGFFELFDLPTETKLVIKSRAKSYIWILHKSLELLEKNLQFGCVHQVYLGVFKPRAECTMIIAVDRYSKMALTMADTSGDLSCVPRFLDKWCGPGTKIIYKSSSIDPARLTSSARHYVYIDVDDQSQLTSAQLQQYKDNHQTVISCFIQEVHETHNRLLLLLNRVPDFEMCAEVQSLHRYFQMQSVVLDRNPFALYLSFLREGITM